MAREELMARIDKVETKRFILWMKDIFNARDWELDKQYLRELDELNARLAQLN